MDFANQWTQAIGRGAEISRKTILVLDTVMVVLAVRQLAVLAAEGVSSGSGPPMMPMPSGVMAATRLDVAAMERTYEAIRKLIFDGFKDGKLIEAKGPGYAQWLELDQTGTLQFRDYFKGARQMAEQLSKHSEIAKRGVAVEWRVAEPRLAEYLRKYIQDKGLEITGVHVPPR